jgi:hypothetical protein
MDESGPYPFISNALPRDNRHYGIVTFHFSKFTWIQEWQEENITITWISYSDFLCLSLYKKVQISLYKKVLWTQILLPYYIVNESKGKMLVFDILYVTDGPNFWCSILFLSLFLHNFISLSFIYWLDIHNTL